MLGLIVLGCSSGDTTTNDSGAEQGSENTETNEQAEAGTEKRDFMIVTSTYPVGSSGYTMSAALADTFQSEGSGIRLRNIPIETDKARVIGVIDGSSDVALIPSSSAFNAFNGFFDYA